MFTRAAGGLTGVSINTVTKPLVETGLHRHIGGTDDVHLEPVAGVRCVVTGHMPVHVPKWHHNVVAIDTGVVQIDEWAHGRLTIARIDGEQIGSWNFEQ